MERQHGSTAGYKLTGLVLALAINAFMGAGILFASQLQHDRTAAAAGELGVAAGAEAFECQYIEQGSLHRIEVQAIDRLQAEEQVCGLAYQGVIIPPALLAAYRPLVADVAAEPFLLAQRESCSCGDRERPVLTVDLVVPPKLGQIEEVRTLPRISNRPEETVRDMVDPEARPPEPRPEPPREQPRRTQEPRPLDIAALADRTEDPNRPLNADNEEGVEHGSVAGRGTVGQGDEYLQRVKATLDNTMRVPASIRSADRARLKARIELRITTAGTILKWSWIERSGTAAFDNMIEQTLERFSTTGNRSFAPPPPRWEMQAIRMTIDGTSLR